MQTESQLIEELRVAAAACGPENKDPPYVRAPFPRIALPLVLRRFAVAAAEAMDVAVESVATPAIATCAAAIGNTCRVRLTQTWTEPAVIWAVTLMESGSLKTPAYNAAVEPLHVAQRLAEEAYAAAQEGYKKARADYEAEASFWRGQPGGGADGKPDGASAEPVAPTPTDYYTSDSTVEAIAVLLGNNPRGLALTRDELSGFFGSFGAYKGGRGADESAYLEFFNAGTVKLNRAGGKRIFVPKAALSIFGTCQPVVFNHAIGAQGAGGGGKATNQVDNGLAARFLIAAPEFRAKQWRDAKAFETRHYAAMIAELLSIPLSRDAEGHPNPALIELSPEAKALFALFVNEHGTYTKSIENKALRYHYAKLEGIAARFALIFYLCDGATSQPLESTGMGARHVLAGIALARWYGREARRVYDGFHSEAEQEKHDLLELIRDHGGEITVREMRRRRERWTDPTAAEMALRALQRAGYGALEHVGPGPRGGRPTVKFVLHPDPPADQPWP